MGENESSFGGRLCAPNHAPVFDRGGSLIGVPVAHPLEIEPMKVDGAVGVRIGFDEGSYAKRSGRITGFRHRTVATLPLVMSFGDGKPVVQPAAILPRCTIVVADTHKHLVPPFLHGIVDRAGGIKEDDAIGLTEVISKDRGFALGIVQDGIGSEFRETGDASTRDNATGNMATFGAGRSFPSTLGRAVIANQVAV